MHEISSGWSRRRFLTLSGMAGLSLAACAARVPAHGGQAQAALGSALENAARDHPVALINRLTWGATLGDLNRLRQRGVGHYVNAQLRPAADPILPPEVVAQLQAMTINRTPVADLARSSFEQLRSIRTSDLAADEKQQQLKAAQQGISNLAREAAEQQLLYALYSPNQLQEQLTWFWMNHFSVFQYKGVLRPMMGDYYARVIKPHALGRFRDLFRATVFSPQMLIYLDNANNARGHINENYAREIMELHTLGVGAGYTQQDVTNLARVLTGLGVNLTDHPLRVRPALRADLWQSDLVVFNPMRHDPDPKQVLGHTFQGHGLDEINAVIELLAAHPATARHISTQLAQYFVADTPPPALIDHMSATWLRTDGDIAAVLQTMLTTQQFAQSLGSLFKDPTHYVVSAVRLAYEGRIIRNAQPMVNWLARLGEPLYGRQTPDGYPLDAAAWSSSGQMTARFELARLIGSGPAGLFKTDAPDAQPSAAFPQLSNAFYYQALQPVLSPATRQALQQASSPQDWNALLLSSPEFMRR
ncbi:MAG: DUF1800 domain-containing protein [Pseudomonadota bacterium]